MQGERSGLATRLIRTERSPHLCLEMEKEATTAKVRRMTVNKRVTPSLEIWNPRPSKA